MDHDIDMFQADLRVADHLGSLKSTLSRCRITRKYVFEYVLVLVHVTYDVVRRFGAQDIARKVCSRDKSFKVSY